MLAFVFPGQGSQHPAMGAPWLDHPSWRLVDEASQACGRDVAALLLDADADQLRNTDNAQLATFVLCTVILDAARERGVEPGIVSGHSLGQYAALVAAGSLSIDDGVRLVAARGEAMYQAGAARPGTMAAVLGLAPDAVVAVCDALDAPVWMANDNAPGQVVIAGTTDGVASAGDAARAAGARKVLPLTVSGAFHSPLMAPASPTLAAALERTTLHDAAIGIVSDVDACVHRSAARWRELLVTQLTSPVRWRECLLALAVTGVSEVVELGPATVLTGTVKRTLPGITARAVSTPDALDALAATRVSNHDDSGAPEGESLPATERLVVAPSAGVFAPAADLALGQHVEPGSCIGTVGTTSVCSAFAGRIAGVLAVAGERLVCSQPVAWLRTES